MEELLKSKIAEAKRLILHPGMAHFDDYFCAAICRALGFRGEIWRREPETCELLDSRVIICDVGKTLRPDVLCWDHHQDKTLPAAFELLATSTGLWQNLVACYPWVTKASKQDIVGPVRMMQDAGYDPAALDCMPPLNQVVLQTWAAHARDEIGEALLAEPVRWVKASFEVDEFWRAVRHYDAYGHSIVDVRYCPASTRPIQRQLMSKWKPELIVTPSDRGPGFNLCTTPGHTIDFNRYQGPVTYNGGWILVLPESASADLTSNGPEGILRQLFQ